MILKTSLEPYFENKYHADNNYEKYGTVKNHIGTGKLIVVIALFCFHRIMKVLALAPSANFTSSGRLSNVILTEKRR